MRKMRISAFSDIIGIAPTTIRDWEAKGIFHPIKNTSGMRYYGERNLQEAVDAGLITQEEMSKAIENRSSK